MTPTCPHRHRHALLLVVVGMLLALLLWGGLALSDKLPIPGLDPDNGSPTRDYLYGFECGVRWGLVAKMLNPEQDSIPDLTKYAKYLHWRIVVGEKKPEAMDCSGHIEQTKE